MNLTKFRQKIFNRSIPKIRPQKILTEYGPTIFEPIKGSFDPISLLCWMNNWSFKMFLIKFQNLGFIVQVNKINDCEKT